MGEFPGDEPGRLYMGANGEHVEGALVGAQLSMHRIFTSGDTLRSAQYLVKQAKETVAEGRMPILSMRTPGRNWRTVAQGEGDDVLRYLAKDLATVGGPVGFTLNHEGDVDLTKGRPHATSPEDWVKMQEHSIRMLASAKNVVVTPILTAWTYRKRGDFGKRWQVPSAKVLGIDSYAVEPARQFPRIVEYARQWNQRVLVAELGFKENVVQNLQATFDYALQHGFMGLSYFNAAGPRGDWTLDAAGRKKWIELSKRPEVARL